MPILAAPKKKKAAVDEDDIAALIYQESQFRKREAAEAAAAAGTNNTEVTHLSSSRKTSTAPTVAHNAAKIATAKRKRASSSYEDVVPMKAAQKHKFSKEGCTQAVKGAEREFSTQGPTGHERRGRIKGQRESCYPSRIAEDQAECENRRLYQTGLDYRYHYDDCFTRGQLPVVEKKTVEVKPDFYAMANQYPLGKSADISTKVTNSPWPTSMTARDMCIMEEAEHKRLVSRCYNDWKEESLFLANATLQYSFGYSSAGVYAAQTVSHGYSQCQNEMPEKAASTDPFRLPRKKKNTRKESLNASNGGKAWMNPRMDLPPQSEDDPLIIMTRLNALMERSRVSQKQLETYDRQNGLPRSHSHTMIRSSRSRLEFQKMLKKQELRPEHKPSGAKSKRKGYSVCDCTNPARNERVRKRHVSCFCSTEGCTSIVKQGGVCRRHGAKTKRCCVQGCTNQVVKGGVCIKHGAKRKLCSSEGCTNKAHREGVCMRHGAKVECSYEGCTSYARKWGLCKRHGSKVNERNNPIVWSK